MQNLPAHETKAVAELAYALPGPDRTRVLLHQDNDAADSTGPSLDAAP